MRRGTVLGWSWNEFSHAAFSFILLKTNKNRTQNVTNFIKEKQNKTNKPLWLVWYTLGPPWTLYSQYSSQESSWVTGLRNPLLISFVPSPLLLQWPHSLPVTFRQKDHPAGHPLRSRYLLVHSAYRVSFLVIFLFPDAWLVFKEYCSSGFCLFVFKLSSFSWRIKQWVSLWSY